MSREKIAKTSVLVFIRREGLLEKLVLSKIFWATFALFFFGYPILRSVTRELPAPPAKLSQLPPFSLINEFNRPFGSKNLQGKVYIASFMFTSCPSTCPKIMKQMQKVQKRVKGLGTRVALVTFTVDPVVDTPKMLFRAARKLQTNPYVWNFLTGDEDQIKKLLLKGFKVPVGEKEDIPSNIYDIAHTEKFVLVDGNGGIRGYYPSDKDGLNMLMIDIGLLANMKSTAKAL